ncbi:unnamed protein product (macronuclear) [Paramecium tetraurelia]|uniref:Uncharacterized protein n=1 Tax=Paramecium tetraurelia TaxID=5888 RepID=A0BYN2_PARTE|nr:uncharacterized protein GSPATT00033502001 [Paramecium tetraurelia]CAK63649.1 unnamed protein product [Paramecium tetraurelia]|eukprot:XP_001431047.1 hypothetical protein (macronuclear) [Paramecium tetraurelia strain d4-2]
MLKIEEYVCNLKESNTLFNDALRIDTHQSLEAYDNTQFQNPIYNIVPLEYFQSVTENKYSNIFSSCVQSLKNEELQSTIKQISKKRTFSFAESQQLNKDAACNISADFGQKTQQPAQMDLKSQSKFSYASNLQNIETPNKDKWQLQDSMLVLNNSIPQSKFSSPEKKNEKVQKFKTKNSSFNVEKNELTQTTQVSKIICKSNCKEFESIFKECQHNFEKNKARKSDEYIACNIQ